MSPRAWKTVRHGLLVYDCIHREASEWVSAGAPLSVSLSDPRNVLSSRAKEVIGPNGIARFLEFWSYAEGWDFGEGRALSPHSVMRFEEFLAAHPGFDRRPSLFLTRAGNLMLAWEDGRDSDIELEFTPGGFVLYLASTGEERVFRSEGIPALLETIGHPAAIHDAS